MTHTYTHIYTHQLTIIQREHVPLVPTSTGQKKKGIYSLPGSLLKVTRAAEHAKAVARARPKSLEISIGNRSRHTHIIHAVEGTVCLLMTRALVGRVVVVVRGARARVTHTYGSSLSSSFARA